MRYNTTAEVDGALIRTLSPQRFCGRPVGAIFNLKLPTDFSYATEFFYRIFLDNPPLAVFWLCSYRQPCWLSAWAVSLNQLRCDASSR